jgi:hypothetical protein
MKYYSVVIALCAACLLVIVPVISGQDMFATERAQDDACLALALQLNAQAQRDEEFQNAVKQSQAEAIRLYPDCAAGGTRLSRRMLEIAKLLRAQKNPIADRSDAPLVIATMAAIELGISPKK